jgi:hypothetical protein
MVGRGTIGERSDEVRRRVHIKRTQLEGSVAKGNSDRLRFFCPGLLLSGENGTETRREEKGKRRDGPGREIR